MTPSQGGQEWGLADQNNGGEPAEDGGDGPELGPVGPVLCKRGEACEGL